MVGEAWQVTLEIGQRMRDQTGGVTHAQQMFQQRLVHLCGTQGVGKHRLIALHETLAFGHRLAVAVDAEAGIVMIGQH